MVLLSITPLLDGVLRLDIIAPFHTSGPPLLQFHLAIEQWGIISSNKAVFPIAFTAFCSAATLCIRGSGTGTWYGDNANVTLTGLSCITPDYVLNGNFIVIGV